MVGDGRLPLQSNDATVDLRMEILADARFSVFAHQQSLCGCAARVEARPEEDTRWEEVKEGREVV